MKTLPGSCFAVVILTCSACGGLGRIPEVATVPHDALSEVPATDQAKRMEALKSGSEDWWAGLREAKAEIESKSASGPTPKSDGLGLMSKKASEDLLSESSRVLPTTFENSVLIQKLVRVAEASITTEQASDIELTASDIRDFVSNAMGRVSPEVSGASYSVEETAVRSKVHSVIKKYLIAYYKGKFVDRAGRSITKPEVKGSISNDSITGFEHVVLEAFYDTVFNGLPAFWKTDAGKEVWLNSGKAEPTGVLLGVIKKEEVKPPETPPKAVITEDQVGVISYLADLGAEQSKAISGWVLREFSDVSLSFVIGGDFAIGDNDTFGKVVDELLQSASRRTIEASMYGYFRKHPLTENQTEAIQKLIKLVEEVRKAIEK
jgi:hypothetical protein